MPVRAEPHPDKPPPPRLQCLTTAHQFAPRHALPRPACLAMPHRTAPTRQSRPAFPRPIAQRHIGPRRNYPCLPCRAPLNRAISLLYVTRLAAPPSPATPIPINRCSDDPRPACQVVPGRSDRATRSLPCHAQPNAPGQSSPGPACLALPDLDSPCPAKPGPPKQTAPALSAAPCPATRASPASPVRTVLRHTGPHLPDCALTNLPRQSNPRPALPASPNLASSCQTRLTCQTMPHFATPLRLRQPSLHCRAVPRYARPNRSHSAEPSLPHHALPYRGSQYRATSRPDSPATP